MFNNLLAKVVDFEPLKQRILSRVVLDKFMQSGSEYEISRKEKQIMIKSFQRVTENIQSGTAWLYHVVLATEILNISPEVKGDVIECGCWKGASAASISIVCEKVGRKLIVCDSFEGLPNNDSQKVHSYQHLKKWTQYRSGMFEGGLSEVQSNIGIFGKVESCEFVKGWFSESLKALKNPIVFGFFDVDLASSMRDCIRYIWPLLVDGGMIYTDDSCDMDVVKVWFDCPWWKFYLKCDAPGYVGSGCGLPLTPNYTSLGYTRKVLDAQKSFEQVKW